MEIKDLRIADLRRISFDRDCMRNRQQVKVEVQQALWNHPEVTVTDKMKLICLMKISYEDMILKCSQLLNETKVDSTIISFLQDINYWKEITVKARKVLLENLDLSPAVIYSMLEGNNRFEKDEVIALQKRMLDHSELDSGNIVYLMFRGKSSEVVERACNLWSKLSVDKKSEEDLVSICRSGPTKLIALQALEDLLANPKLSIEVLRKICGRYEFGSMSDYAEVDARALMAMVNHPEITWIELNRIHGDRLTPDPVNKRIVEICSPEYTKFIRSVLIGEDE